MIKNIGICFGGYCPMHQGHLDLIMKAKKENDICYVVVCGYTDEPRGNELGLNINNRKIVHIPFNDVLKLDLPQASDLMYQRMLHLILDVSKIKRITRDWQAKIDFRTGLTMTFDWLYEDPSHRRIVHNVAKQMAVLDSLYENEGE